MADTPGALLAHRYRLVEQLGRGGMGVVWRARDEVFSRDVAIKEVLLPPHLTDTERETVIQRTRREARVAARLSHPNVVKVYDVVESDGRPWIVMELVRAKSLTDIVEENGPLPPQRVAAIGLQVLSALTAAHAAGITHRDVKPGNVLCSENGRVVLSDFGIATIADDPSVTVNGVLMGSPAYIAPERVRGGPARAASDLWSLAATLYAAVEGRPPYDRGSAVPTVTAVVNEDPDPLQRAGLLAPVLQQIFVKDPDARPDAASIRTMLREVASTPEAGEGAVAGATVQLSPQTDRDGAERPRMGTSIVRPRPERDEPAKAAATAIVSAVKASAKTKPAPEPKVPSQRRRTPLVVAALAVAFLLIGGSALQNVVSQAKDRPTSSAEDRTTPSPTPSPDESSQAPSPSNGSPKPSPSAPPVTDSDNDRRPAAPVVTIPRPSASKSASPKPTTKPSPKPTKTTSPTPKPTPTTEPTTEPTPTPTLSPPDPGGGGGEPPAETSEPTEPTEPAAPAGDEPAVPAA